MGDTDSPVIHLQKGEVRLSCNLSFLIFRGVGVLKRQGGLRSTGFVAVMSLGTMAYVSDSGLGQAA